jgi:arsenate reductase (thioredoxin)
MAIRWVQARGRAGSIAAAIAGVLAAAVNLCAAASQPPTPSVAAASTRVLFMCPHGAGKSVLAAAYFERLAKERGLDVRVDAVGTEPDPAVAPVVVGHLKKQGYGVPVRTPRSVTSDDWQGADVVISMGCDLKGRPTPRGVLRTWDDVPGPGENLAGADEAIRRHVLALVEELVRQKP